MRKQVDARQQALMSLVGAVVANEYIAIDSEGVINPKIRNGKDDARCGRLAYS
jgi:hypothetical protein